ncbi:MAG: ribosomal RNA small subunit methyltransferase A [Flavobacteriales bacterium]|nr:ribosomal RNA small subunit methyltransferase A [Flavobacteriales bacterium]
MNPVRPKKHLGQHFLKEEAIAQRVAEGLTGHGGYEHVMEVGPGTGALTKHLLALQRWPITCFEVDQESVAYLREHYPQLDVRPEDFLRMRPGSVTEGRFAVAGNFPYNISTQIVFKVLEHRDCCTELVGMFQKEVADRIRAPHGSKTYGITSVLAQAFYDVELLFHVEPGSFIPPPKVRSSVIRMRRNAVEALPCDEALFFRVVKTAFNQRRKTLHNALKPLPDLKGPLPEAYSTKRAEQLSVSDFIALTQAIQAAA